jgi:hypothetical protein
MEFIILSIIFLLTFIELKIFTIIEVLPLILSEFYKIILSYLVYIIAFFILIYLFSYFKNDLRFYIFAFASFLSAWIVGKSWNDFHIYDIVYVIICVYCFIHLSELLNYAVKNIPDNLLKNIKLFWINLKLCYINRPQFNKWISTLAQIFFLFRCLKDHILSLSILKNWKEPTTIALYFINIFFILIIFLSDLLNQELQYMAYILSIIIYIFIILNYLSQHNHISLVPVIIAILGGFIPTALIFSLENKDYVVFTTFLYIYFFILFIFIIYDGLKNYRLFFKQIEYAETNWSGKVHKDSIIIMKKIFSIAIFLILFVYIFAPVSSLSFSLTATKPQVNLENLSLEKPIDINVNDITASYNSLFYKVIKPTILLFFNNITGINITLDSQRLKPDSCSKIRLNISDLADQNVNQITLNGKFILFNLLNCSDAVNTTFIIKLPDIITLTSDKSSPQPTGTPIKWQVKRNCDIKRCLNYSFYIYNNKGKISWNQMQAQSNNFICVWNTSLYEAGNYTIKVIVTDDNDRSWNKIQKCEFYISTCPPPTVNLSKEYNVFTANGTYNKTCNTNISYRFFTSVDRIHWDPDRNWSPNPEWVPRISSRTPVIGEKYYLKVEIKDDLYNPEVQIPWNFSSAIEPFYLYSIGYSDDTSFETSDQSSEKPSDQSSERPSDQSSERPLDQSSERPSDQSSEKPSDQSSEKSSRPTSETVISRTVKNSKMIISEVNNKFLS